MQFTIVLSLFSLTAFIAAAPVPEPQLAAAGLAAGVTCPFLPDECKAIGDTGKQAFKEIGIQREKTVEQNGVVPVALTDTLAAFKIKLSSKVPCNGYNRQFEILD
ncbi:hypothetical protein TWF132_000516 [Orbilia oligospora]|nr:hypothetical protein TWF132_000516 [Orbilia oligospora]